MPNRQDERRDVKGRVDISSLFNRLLRGLQVSFFYCFVKLARGCGGNAE